MNPFRFIMDYFKIWRGSMPAPLLSLRPAGKGGKIDRHYFYQDCWAIRRIMTARPGMHVDFGSRVDGFVGQLAATGMTVARGTICVKAVFRPWIGQYSEQRGRQGYVNSDGVLV